MSRPRFINVFLLGMLNLSALDSLRSLPVIAEYGWQAPLYYCLATLLFLFPSALVSAELATGWPEREGVYIWVKEAFGPRLGFFAIWMQWIHNATWFPTLLSFVAATLAYLFEPALAESRPFLVGVILIVFWGFTLFNCLSLKHSAWFSAFCTFFGTFLPGLLLVAFALRWALKGGLLQAPFSVSALIPKIGGIQDLVFLSGMILSFGGLEISAGHAKEVKDPGKNYPRAIFIAALATLLLYVSGALSIAIMIPREKISLVSGLIETLSLFLQELRASWLLLPAGAMIILGALAELNSWIAAPSRALQAASQSGEHLPPLFRRLNRHGMPAHLLVLQGIIATCASFVFLYMPSASSGFWILSALSVQLYLLMYILMFLAAIRLRYNRPLVARAYRVPFGKLGIWTIASLGAATSLFIFLLSFAPPAHLGVGSLWFYEGFLFLGVSTMAAVPFLLHRFSRTLKMRRNG